MRGLLPGCERHPRAWSHRNGNLEDEMNRHAWPAWLVPGQFVEPFLKGQKNDFPRRASRAMLMLRFVKLPGQRKSAKTVEGGNEQNGPPLPIFIIQLFAAVRFLIA
jgi:hypothetical protein